MDKKYVAYIGSYTNYGKSKGIAVFDVDAEKGILTQKGDVEVHNCSAICASKDGKFVYAVVDEGVAAFAVEKDGNLRPLNTGSIRGMRGCSIDVDSKNHFLIVAGYHDSKLTVVKIEEDGSYYIGGHSKGGNLALYAACELPARQWDQVRRLYLLDSPGLCSEVM